MVSTVMPQMGSIALVVVAFMVLFLSWLSPLSDTDRESVAVLWGVTPIAPSAGMGNVKWGQGANLDKMPV